MMRHFLLATVVPLASALIGMLVSVGMAQEIELRGDLINDVDQATVAFHPATPYVESSTLLLADINLDNVDVEETARWLHQFAGVPENEPATGMIRGFVDSLRGAGVSHLFATVATRSPIDGGPIVVVPCENPAVVNGLATVLLQQVPKDSPHKVHVGDKIVLAGATTAIDRVTETDGAQRPDLILPLKAADRLDHSVVVALPDESRAELVALWPDRLPPQWPVQFSPREMVRDISSVVVSWRLPPDPEVLVRVETTDASAVERVKAVLEKVLALSGDAKPSIEMQVDVATLKLRATPETFAKTVGQLIAPSRKHAALRRKMNSMKQIGLAIHNYNSKEKHLPPRFFTDRQGKPLLSWRVALLPHIDQMAMYRAMQLDEKWDGENNWMPSKTLIPVYCDDSRLGAKTTIRAPVYPGSIWHGDGPPKKFRNVMDGTSNTIAAIDAPASAAIEWANPQPWVLSMDDPMSDVFGDRETAVVLMLDGSVRTLQKSEMTNQKLKAMLTIAGGEVIDWP